MGSSKTCRLITTSLAALAAGASAFTAASSAAPPKKAGRPLVSTGGVTHVVGTKADLNGGVNPRTLATTYYFQYGPTTAYGSQTTPATLPAGNVIVKVTQTVAVLLPGYHYRLVAANAEGTNSGRDRTFTVKAKVKAKTKKTAFSLPKTFQPTVYGGTFILDGTLTGADNANRSIVLQASRYPYTGLYTNVGGPILTGPTGSFSFRVSHMTSSTRFRISTVAAPAVTSPLVTEPVTVKVTLKVHSSGRKGFVRLYGTVTPAAVGSRVFFELERSAKPKSGRPAKPEKQDKAEKAEESEKGPTFAPKFNTLVKRGTRTISRFSEVVSIRDAGRYRAFVEVKSGPVTSGSSSDIALSAVPAKAKKKKKA